MNDFKSSWDRSNCYFAEVIKNYDKNHPNQILVQAIPLPITKEVKKDKVLLVDGQAWVSLISDVVANKNDGNGIEEYGSRVIPEVGSIVVVIRFDEYLRTSGEDFVLGTFWNPNSSTLPVTNPLTDEAFEDKDLTELQYFIARDGTTFLLDESKARDNNKTTFSIYNPNNNFKFIIDNDNNNMNLTADVPGDFNVKTKNNISLSGYEGVGFAAPKIDFKTKKDFKMKSTKGAMNFSSIDESNFKGQKIELNKGTNNNKPIPQTIKTETKKKLLVITKGEETKSPNILVTENSFSYEGVKNDAPSFNFPMNIPISVYYTEDKDFDVLVPFAYEKGPFKDFSFPKENEKKGSKNKKVAGGKPPAGGEANANAQNEEANNEVEWSSKTASLSFDSKNLPAELKGSATFSLREKMTNLCDGNGRKIVPLCENVYLDKQYNYKMKIGEDKDKNNKKIYKFSTFESSQSGQYSFMQIPSEFRTKEDENVVVTDIIEYGFKSSSTYTPQEKNYVQERNNLTIYGRSVKPNVNNGDIVPILTDDFNNNFMSNLLTAHKAPDGLGENIKFSIDSAEVFVVLKVKSKPRNKVFVRFNYIAPFNNKTLAFEQSEVEPFPLGCSIFNAFKMSCKANQLERYNGYLNYTNNIGKGSYIKRRQVKNADFTIANTLLLEDYGSLLKDAQNGSKDLNLSKELESFLISEYGKLGSKGNIQEWDDNSPLLEHANFFLNYYSSPSFFVFLRESKDQKFKASAAVTNKVGDKTLDLDLVEFIYLFKASLWRDSDPLDFFKGGCTPEQFEYISKLFESFVSFDSMDTFSKIVEKQKEKIKEEKDIDYSIFNDDNPLDIFILPNIQYIMPVLFLDNEFIFDSSKLKKLTGFPDDITLDDKDLYAFSYSTLETPATHGDYYDKYAGYISDNKLDEYFNDKSEYFFKDESLYLDKNYLYNDRLYKFYIESAPDRLKFISYKGEQCAPYLFFSRDLASVKLALFITAYVRDMELKPYFDDPKKDKTKKVFEYYLSAVKELSGDIYRRGNVPFHAQNLCDSYRVLPQPRIIGNRRKSDNGVFPPILDKVYSKQRFFNLTDKELEKDKSPEFIKHLFGDSYENLSLISRAELENNIKGYFDNTEKIGWDDVKLRKNDKFTIATTKFIESLWRVSSLGKEYSKHYECVFLVPIVKTHKIESVVE